MQPIYCYASMWMIKQDCVGTLVELLLQPSDYCTAWINEVHDNPDIKKEYNAFKKGPEIEKVTRIVSKRLGFGSSIGFGTYVLLGYKRGKITGGKRENCIILNYML